MDSNISKAVLLVLLIIYVISPIDAVPGPIDDLLLLLFALGTSKIKSNEKI